MKQAVLIGLGMVSSAYAASFADLRGRVALRGVYARMSESRRAFLDAHAPQAIDYPDLAAVLADRTLDFAIVTTPPDARMDLVAALSGAGLPVLMEKPVERTLNAAKQLCETCETAAVPLGIVLQHRLRPSATKLREVLAQGHLGRLHAAEITVPWWRPQSYYDVPGRGTRARDGGGVMINQAIHTMDLALSLLPPVSEVTAMTGTSGFHDMETEDFVSAGLRFQGGALGTLSATTAAYPGRAEEIRLYYQNASVLLSVNTLTISWQDGREERFGTEAASGAGADPMAFTHEWHRDIIADFADALTHNRPPAVPGREALAVHALIEAIERAAATGQRQEVLT